jgi:hypothetical protein
MTKNQKVAVWLTRDAALAFLGIDTPQPQSRWVVFGKYLSTEASIGFWMRVDHVEQWTAMGFDKRIKFSHPDCLLFWDRIITIQALDKFEGFEAPAFPN